VQGGIAIMRNKVGWSRVFLLSRLTLCDKLAMPFNLLGTKSGTDIYTGTYVTGCTFYLVPGWL